MNPIWKPYNMSRCDCETKEHSYFCIYSQYQRVTRPEIGTETVRPVNAKQVKKI